MARPAKRVRGAKEFSRKLERMRGTGPARIISEALFAAGDIVRVEAQISITRGAVSGKHHVPSKPGEPPNADTHLLADNIETVQPDPYRVEVSSNAPYSKPLEFGSSKVRARPFMRPARDKTKGEVRDLIAKAVRAARKKVFSGR